MPATDIDLTSVLELPASLTSEVPDSKIEKFVVFQVDDDFFGVPATGVKEVALPQPITLLPGSPVWLHGLANLRGEIVAIANFPYRRNPFRISSRSKIVVFRLAEFDTLVGFVVDKISEIVAIRGSDVKPSADVNIQGVAKLNSADVGILDVDRLFSSLVLN